MRPTKSNNITSSFIRWNQGNKMVKPKETPSQNQTSFRLSVSENVWYNCNRLYAGRPPVELLGTSALMLDFRGRKPFTSKIRSAAALKAVT